MNKLNELIQYYNENSSKKEHALIKVNLKLISELIESIEGSRDRIYVDKIISTCLEIIDIQREMIHNRNLIDEIPFGKDTETISDISTPHLGFLQVNNDGNEIETARELNPYMPPDGGFTDDVQIRAAFANYLKYHVVKKDGSPKKFADTTVYDYCSRVKVLWEIFREEWQRDALNKEIPIRNINYLPGKTFMNAYNNVDVIDFYIYYKSIELNRIEMGERAPFTAEEISINPLNNARNLANTSAALGKFIEFKKSIEDCR